jgi:signal transduction histidine kinase
MKDSLLFPKLNDYQIECAVEAGEVVSLADGEVIFREGEAAEAFFVVLEGKIKVTQNTNGDEAVLALHEPGEFTGTTELLTGGAATATGWALGPTKVARVPVERFQQLIMACPEMRALLIPVLTERRVTEFRIATQQQKLAALGKLSAGLAHELNNPASAALRSAQNLSRVLGDVESLCCELLSRVMSDTGNGTGAGLKGVCELASHTGEPIDPLERSDREQEMGEWLESRKVSQPWEAAGALVAAGIMLADVKPLAGRVAADHFPNLITWLAKSVEMRSLCRELEESTSRMSEIVGAMKSYTHMDQAQAKAPNDLREGIETTLTILKHKLKKKDLAVEKEFGPVAPVPAYGGELNQVWTNLIHNAIDAAPEGGKIAIRTSVEGDEALIEIIDNGPGIPPEIQPRIFEPFFTTKGVGEGTGLGLDTTYRIVRHHDGTIKFDTRPGQTRFSVRLPLVEREQKTSGTGKSRARDFGRLNRAAAVP